MTINNIITQIATKGSIYDEIIDNIITTNQQLKPALISEVAIAYLENAKKIEEVYKQGYFKYYFIMTVKNQVHSSTSPLWKNVRCTSPSTQYLAPEAIDDTEDIIKYLEILEYQNEQIQQARRNTKMTYFESEMIRNYYDLNKSYRQIGSEYGIDFTLVFKVVKEVKQRMIKYINDNENNK
jgi:uncharacterized protein YfaT (DUF1175 family)